jgi:hypothetical protein
VGVKVGEAVVFDPFARREGDDDIGGQNIYDAELVAGVLIGRVE